MNRKTQSQVFKDAFPHVDITSTQGMLMFQGFLGGYERGHGANIYDRKAYKNNITALRLEIEDLREQLKNLNIFIKTADLWMKTGDEV